MVLHGLCIHLAAALHAHGPRDLRAFFIYARRMEECYPPGASAFQYILTTTPDPPADMQEGSPWLLGSRLNGKTKNGRLLKDDF